MSDSSENEPDIPTIDDSIIKEQSAIGISPGKLVRDAAAISKSERKETAILNNSDLNQHKQTIIPCMTKIMRSTYHNKSPKIKSFIWNDEDLTLKLIELWKKHHENCKNGDFNNIQMWELIAIDIGATIGSGMAKPTAQNCNNRWKAMKLSYRKHISQNKKPSEKNPAYLYFDQMDEIYGKESNQEPSITELKTVSEVRKRKMKKDATHAEESPSKAQNLDLDHSNILHQQPSKTKKQKKSRYKSPANNTLFFWKDDSWTLKLIEIWKTHQEKSRYDEYNRSEMWIRIASDMEATIIDPDMSALTADHCSNRWKAMKNTYMKYIRRNRKPENGSKPSLYFDEFDEIYRGRAQPQFLNRGSTEETIENDDGDDSSNENNAQFSWQTEDDKEPQVTLETLNKIIIPDEIMNEINHSLSNPKTIENEQSEPPDEINQQSLKHIPNHSRINKPFKTRRTTYNNYRKGDSSSQDSPQFIISTEASELPSNGHSHSTSNHTQRSERLHNTSDHTNVNKRASVSSSFLGKRKINESARNSKRSSEALLQNDKDDASTVTVSTSVLVEWLDGWRRETREHEKEMLQTAKEKNEILREKNEILKDILTELRK